ncbi:hypothetical protein HZR84_10615 [Hyphobacterium sp. CCMP332]|nr:hypothetical protein HZR84_10615 [Hyphobacterium sp. CCMP332]
MNALELQNRLEGLNLKLQDFFNSYREIKIEMENLKKENSELKVELESKSRDLENFQNNHKIGKLVDKMDSGGMDSTELKNLLDRYIGEIDQCIDLLKE